MSKIAFVFPGQGAQKVGMGKDAFDASDKARAVFNDADAALGEKLSTLCFEGPAETLQLTANTQPAILTTSVALLNMLGERADMVAGHSLGEYSAHVAAGSLDLKSAVQLVRKRGQYMQDAVPVGEGAMAAVLGLDATKVEEILKAVQGVAEPVNYNCPGQLVIAGATQAITQASEQLKLAGGKVIALPVSAPFHSSLMKPAEEHMAVHLRDATFTNPKIPVYVNVDANAITTAEQSRDTLIRQISRPVRWENLVKQMIVDGATLFIEIGPGKALTGMLARIDKSIASASLQSPTDLDAVRARIAEHR